MEPTRKFNYSECLKPKAYMVNQTDEGFWTLDWSLRPVACCRAGKCI